MCYHVSLVSDYGVLPHLFGTWLRCVSTFFWYLTTVSYHVRLVVSTESVPHTFCYLISLVPDYGLSPRSFDTWLRSVTTYVWYLNTESIPHLVRLVSDYGVLQRYFGSELRCVTTLVWYLTTVCFHVRLVPDYDVLPRSFGTWLRCLTTFVWYWVQRVFPIRFVTTLVRYLITVCHRARLTPD